MKRVAVDAATLGLVAAASLAPLNAAAESDGAPEPAQIEKAVTTKTPAKVALKAKSESTSRAASTRISGCYGRTHNPHRSYSFASVHGETSCGVRASMIVSINLSRGRWYGWQHLASGYKSGYSYKVDGNAKWYCARTGTYTYRGVSYHRATIGGRSAIGYTSNTDRFSC